MKVAYIILAYNKPDQLGRLIRKLIHKDAAFYIHIDKKSNYSDFKQVLTQLPDLSKITLLPREVIYWGGLGIITAILNGLRSIIKSGNFNRIVLLSGQDYPIKSNRFIFKFFENNPQKNFIPYFKLPHKEWSNGGMRRIENYHFRMLGRIFAYPPLGKPIHLYSKVFYKLLKIRFRKPRQFPKYLQPYGGFTWWRITGEAALEILNFVENHPDYLSYHKYSHISDEMFFQTILLNSKNDALLNSIVNSDLSYIKWTQGNPHPEILKAKDFEDLRKTDALFARKFDTHVDSNILNMIDEQLLSY
jgi:hypothetical protein